MHTTSLSSGTVTHPAITPLETRVGVNGRNALIDSERERKVDSMDAQDAEKWLKMEKTEKLQE